MQKLLILIVPFALLPLGARSQQQTPAPVSEILTWISNHFEVADASMIVTFSNRGVDMDKEEFKTSIAFQGCNVSVTQVETDNYSNIDTGQFDYSMEQTGTANLDLSKALPDEITAGKGSQEQPPAHLIIRFAQPFAWHQEQKYSAHPVPADIFDTFDVKLVEIDFATQEMTNSQAKAWHDAIVACGGKPSAH